LLKRLSEAFRWLVTRAADWAQAPGSGSVAALAAVAVVAVLFGPWWLTLAATLALAGATLAWHRQHRRQMAALAEREAKLPQATQFEQIEAQLAERQRRLDALEHKLADAEATLERRQQAEQWLAENEPRVQQIEQQRQEQQDLQAERDRLREQIDSDTRRVQAIARKIGTLEGQQASAEHQLSTVQQQLDAAQQQLEQARREAESQQTRRKQLAGEVADLEDQRRQRDELRQELTSLTQQRDTARDQRDQHQRQCDDAQAQIDRLQQQVQALEARAKEAGEQVEALTARKASLSQTVAEFESTKERHDALAAELREMETRRATLSEQVAGDDTRRQQLGEKLEQLNAEVTEQQQTLQQLSDEHQSLTEQRNALRSEVAELEPTAERYRTLKQQVESLEQQSSSLSQQVASAEQQLQAKNERCQALDSQLQTQRSELAELGQQLEQLQSHHGTLQAEAAESETLRDRRDQHANELKQQIEQRQTELQTIEQQLEAQQQKRRELSETVEGLTARKAQTEQTIETLDETLKEMRLQQGYRGSNAGPLSELWKPALRPETFTGPTRSEEPAVLDQMQQHLANMGLHYADRTLKAFHTAMKVQDHSPLCVLAGLSGTGKSELARRYAEGMGMHFLNLAVQPRWDDPQDMFGFFNYLENQYRATELARALVQMDPFAGEAGRGWSLPEEWDHSLSDRMLVVLLDEMNLAHVEYYFSEFLSRLELRRGINKHDPSDRRQAEMTLEIGAHGAGDPTMRLLVDTNVLFVGTINEDETTQTLSEKVIDRANMLSFAAPHQLRSARASSAGERPRHFLPYENWRQWLTAPDAWQGEASEQVDRWIDQLNQAMALIQRPLGYRTYTAMRAYAANYPDQSETGLRHAVADQIEQKILPKFRGLDPTDQPVGSALEQIVTLAEQCEDRPLVQAIERSRDQGAQQYHFSFLGIDRGAGRSPAVDGAAPAGS
jgi:predicted  nucleic acid-binding Zn-ribbon protein